MTSFFFWFFISFVAPNIIGDYIGDYMWLLLSLLCGAYSGGILVLFEHEFCDNLENNGGEEFVSC